MGAHMRLHMNRKTNANIMRQAIQPYPKMTTYTAYRPGAMPISDCECPNIPVIVAPTNHANREDKARYVHAKVGCLHSHRGGTVTSTETGATGTGGTNVLTVDPVGELRHCGHLR